MARRPDLTLILRVAPEEAARRRAARKGTPELYETDELQRQIAASYDQAPRWFGDDHIVVLDGHGSVGEVAARIDQTMAEAFPSLGG